jgi:hypothetical protein
VRRHRHGTGDDLRTTGFPGPSARAPAAARAARPPSAVAAFRPNPPYADTIQERRTMRPLGGVDRDYGDEDETVGAGDAGASTEQAFAA